MKYCQNTTENNPLANKFKTCVQSLQILFKNEGAKKSKFIDETCINLDCAEIEICKIEKRNQRNTMDFSIGLKYFTETGKEKFVYLLCELKLRLKTINNFREKEIKKKLANSKLILANDNRILEKYIFIFQPNMKNEANHRIRRFSIDKDEIIVFNISEFHNKYFF